MNGSAERNRISTGAVRYVTLINRYQKMHASESIVGDTPFSGAGSTIATRPGRYSRLPNPGPLFGRNPAHRSGRRDLPYERNNRDNKGTP